VASSPVSVRRIIAWDGRRHRRHEPSRKRRSAAVRFCIVVFPFPSLTKLSLSGVRTRTYPQAASAVLIEHLGPHCWTSLCCSLLLGTYDVTYWIPAHLVWQTSEKYPSRNSSVDQNGFSTLGSNKSARRGEKKPPIAASRYQQHAIQTSPS
jgi:hypothetical protein